MTIKEIKTALNSHSIRYTATDYSVFAKNEWTEQGMRYMSYLDVTEYSRKELQEWMGY